MGKKKNCRRTPAEQAIHEEAVRLRRMTDRQLVEQFHRAAEPEMAASVPSVSPSWVNTAASTASSGAVRQPYRPFAAAVTSAVSSCGFTYIPPAPFYAPRHVRAIPIHHSFSS